MSTFLRLLFFGRNDNHFFTHVYGALGFRCSGIKEKWLAFSTIFPIFPVFSFWEATKLTFLTCFSCTTTLWKVHEINVEIKWEMMGRIHWKTIDIIFNFKWNVPLLRPHLSCEGMWSFSFYFVIFVKALATKLGLSVLSSKETKFNTDRNFQDLKEILSSWTKSNNRCPLVGFFLTSLSSAVDNRKVE